MLCLVLAAGYATRLYPLTRHFPKPLLDVGGKPILDWLIDDISESNAVGNFVVLSNHQFAHCFDAWAQNKPDALRERITILDDGTNDNETRLGAVRDMLFAIESLHTHEDMLVIAGDNVLDFSLTRFIDYALEKRTSCAMRYFEADRERLRKSGVVEIGEDDLIRAMTEKPASPQSNWCVPPFYYYTRADARLVRQAIEQGCATDAPGSFLAWLCTRVPVHAMLMPGKRYDIGNLQNYDAVCATYRGIIRR